MEKAIKKAIEGGYMQDRGWTESMFFASFLKEPSAHYLDHIFWQCLGKAEGWGTEMVLIDEKGHPKEWCYYYHCPVCGEIVTGELQECLNECQTENAPIESWLYEWHNFIDHIASGKSIDSFFEELLSAKE